MRRRGVRRAAASGATPRSAPADRASTESPKAATTPSRKQRTAARGASSSRATLVDGVPVLQRYGHARSDSGVRAYASLPGAIVVEFSNGSVYLYTDASTGAGCIARMQRLARMGRGLSTLISRVVRSRYAARLR